MPFPHASLLALSLLLARHAQPIAVDDGVIVGRAVCRGSTWLLTDRRRLARWSANDDTSSVVSLGGLRSDDRPWGLACLDDGSLWTLAAPRALARLDGAGRVQERVDLPLPRVALFGVGNRLLFQQFPVSAGAAALDIAPPRQPQASRRWPGLVTHGEASREIEIARNLVTCGIGVGDRLPCWFTDARQFSISDGVTGRLVDLSALLRPIGDVEAPIHDVALVERGHWVLAGARRPPGPQRGGVRIIYRTADDAASASLDLSPSARLILAADDDRCVLLRSDGRVVDVERKR